MMTYEATMTYGSRQYGDVLTMLAESGLPAVFLQTGGMNAAIEVSLETGQTLLITDADDSLAWRRTDHVGWAVARYPPGEVRGTPDAFRTTDDGRLEGLRLVIDAVLFHRSSPSDDLWR